MCEARASHHALTDSTRAANATNRVRSMTCATEFFSESILERLPQDLEDLAAELGPFIQEGHAVVGTRPLARHRRRPTPLLVKNAPS